MVGGKRRTSSRTLSKTKSHDSGQKTLLHHFTRQASSPVNPVNEIGESDTLRGAGSAANDDASSEEIPPRSLSVPEQPTTLTDAIPSSAGEKIKIKPAVPQARKLFPLFEKPLVLQDTPVTQIDVDGIHAQDDIIDITGEVSSSHSSGTSQNQPQGLTHVLSPMTLGPAFSPSNSYAVPEIIIISDGGSRDDPIVIEHSPVKSRPETRSKAIFVSRNKSTETRSNSLDDTPNTHSSSKAIFPIFTPRKKREHTPISSQTSAKRLESVDAPFPDEDWQHIRGPQSLFHPSPLLLGRQEKGNRSATLDGGFGQLPRLDADILDNNSYFSSSLGEGWCCSAVGSVEKDEHLMSIPKSHRQNYPAITQILRQIKSESSSTSSPSHQLWTDKWRPKRAEEILGNEHSALYLRDWLQVLTLQTESDPNITTNPKGTDDDRPKGKKRKGKTNQRNSKDEPITKKPRVVRTVDKKRSRRRGSMDSDNEQDWIVETEDEDPTEPELNESEDDLEFCRQTLSRLHHKSDSIEPPESQNELDAHPEDNDNPLLNRPTPNFRERLTNTVLLVGPPGSGKTASVYACAEELGWDVFEVYPGIGKRSGSNLDGLVGDVGKNHTLNRGVFRKPAGLFARNTEKENREVPMVVDADQRGVQDQENLPPSLVSPVASQNQDADHRTGSVPPAKQEEGQIRQSLVLLEEVDVLYKDDQNFWPAVINLIKECRRPVIMTCNDISLVPVHDLPLQDILTFAPSSSSVTASYLQCLCLAEGLLIDRELLTRLYESIDGSTLADAPDEFNQARDHGFSSPDLKRTINHLQLWCSGNTNVDQEPRRQSLRGVDTHILEDRNMHLSADWSPCEGSAENTLVTSMDLKDPSEALQRLARHADTVSLMDCNLSRKPWNTPEMLAENDLRPSADDETGHRILFARPAVSDLQVTTFYDRDHQINAELVRYLRKSLTNGPLLPMISEGAKVRGREGSGMSLFRARVAHVSAMVAVLGSILPLSSNYDPLVPSLAWFLDYEPWVRSMVAVDDIEERQNNPHTKHGRKTRNSQKYVRYVTLTEEQRGILGSTAFQMGDA